MKIFRNVSVVSLVAVIPSLVGAAVITDPTLFTLADAIDPAGASEVTVNASNSTPQATVELLPGFAAIHDFAFAGNQTVNEPYIFSFGDPARADVRLSYTATVADKAVQITNNAFFSTSLGSSMRLEASGAGASFGMRIELGSYDGATFTPFSGGTGVTAMAFTVTGPYQRLTGDSATVQYYSAEGSLLSSQTITSSAEVNVAGYSGHLAVGGLIAYAEISFADDNVAIPILALDDLGYSATIPEPQAFLLSLLALPLLVVRRARV